ncbi:MAG: amidohydrolase family protein, partial [Candidatus Nanopelagicales bacterium]|nr:amidohydrolase family protein [Candidatus Nanopelagicales bacterium]
MASMLITGIGLLSTQADGGDVRDAAVVMDGGSIAWVGAAAAAPAADERIDVEGRTVIPGFVDSHAHLIFAGERSAEFAARMSGQSYSAGGIRSTVTATRAASDEDLRANVARLT